MFLEKRTAQATNDTGFLQECKFCHAPLAWPSEPTGRDIDIVSYETQCKCKTLYFKTGDNGRTYSQDYLKNGKTDMECVECGSKIERVRREFGGGNYESVPYCPRCEPKPSRKGSRIRE